jgi:Holliday junction resolvasome RuvABC ATP-dependent DNA helicase subunit
MSLWGVTMRTGRVTGSFRQQGNSVSGDLMRQTIAIGEAFRPGAPIDRAALFAGRNETMTDVIRAVAQRGQHVILFGERGVGKTSLANILSELLTDAGWTGLGCGTINADPTDDFSSLMRKAFKEIAFNAKVAKLGFNRDPDSVTATLADWLPERVTPDDVRSVLQHWGQNTIIVIDELDRISDETATTLLADTIKNLSDHAVNATLILVGVADSVEQLIGGHQSIERALVQVRMPRMSTEELYEIVEKGMARVELDVEPAAKHDIARLSQGLPHFTHLLAQHAAYAAVADGRDVVTEVDVAAATKSAVAKAQQSIIAAYHKATNSPQKETLYAKVLLACALADTDDLGFFAAADVRAPLSRIMEKPVDIPAFSQHLKNFAEERRGPVLQKRGEERRFRFRFVNPMMQPFVVLHGIANELYKLPPEPITERARRRPNRDSTDPAQRSLFSAA